MCKTDKSRTAKRRIFLNEIELTDCRSVAGGVGEGVGPLPVGQLIPMSEFTKYSCFFLHSISLLSYIKFLFIINFLIKYIATPRITIEEIINNTVVTT